MTEPTGRHAAETSVGGGILGTQKAQAVVDSLTRSLQPLAEKLSKLEGVIDKATRGAQTAHQVWNGGSNKGSMSKGRGVGGDPVTFSGRAGDYSFSGRGGRGQQRQTTNSERWMSTLPTGLHRDDGSMSGRHRAESDWVDAGNSGGGIANGGGATFSGAPFNKQGRTAGGIGAVFTGLRSYGKDNLSQFTGADYLASYNRIGGGSGAYNATLATVYGSHNQGLNYAALNMKDATNAAWISQNATGLLASDPRYRASFRQTSALGLVNPLAGSTGGAQWQADVGSSQSFYAARMYGVGNTRVGGQITDPRQITRNLMARTHASGLTNQQFAAASSDVGGFGVSMRALGAQAGWSESTIQGNMQYARSLTAAQNKGWSASDFDRALNIAGGSQAGSQKAALARLRGVGIDSSMFERMRDRQSVTTGRGADVIKDFAPAVIAASDALGKLSAVVTDLTNNIPGLRNILGGGAGIASQLGGAAASAGSVYAGVRGVAAVGKIAKNRGFFAKTFGGGPSGVSGGSSAVGKSSGVAGKWGGLSGSAAGAVIGAGTTPDMMRPAESRYFQKNGKYYEQDMWPGENDWSSSQEIPGKLWNKFTKNGTVNIGGGSLAGGGGSGGGATVGGNNGHTGSEVVKAAMSKLGDPYVWGATGPNSFDCSGLTQFAYKQIGISIPRTSGQQAGAGKPVDRSQLQLGDLLFYNYGSGRNGRGVADHVGIYAGGGKMIDAPTAGKNVETTGIDWKHFIGARRFLGAAGTMTGTGDTLSKSQGDAGPGQNVSAGTSGSYGSTEELEAVLAGLGAFGGSGGSSSATSGSTAASGGAGGTSAPTGPANPTGNAALGKSKASARGWTGAQWDALNTLIMHESGWRNTAQNPTSSAYGIFQFLNSTWGSHKKTSDAGLQIDYGLDYIKGRYKDPKGAWGFWQQHHWYADGAWEIKGDQTIQAHDGEMVINKQKSKTIRDALLQEGNPTRQMGGSGGGVSITIGHITVTCTGSMTEDAAKEAGRQIIDQIAADNRIQKIMVGV